MSKEKKLIVVSHQQQRRKPNERKGYVCKYVFDPLLELTGDTSLD